MIAPAPVASAHQSSVTDTSKHTVVHSSTRSLPLTSHVLASQVIRETAPLCSISTPFGAPVLPLVYIMYTRSVGRTCRSTQTIGRDQMFMREVTTGECGDSGASVCTCASVARWAKAVDMTK